MPDNGSRELVGREGPEVFGERAAIDSFFGRIETDFARALCVVCLLSHVVAINVISYSGGKSDEKYEIALILLVFSAIWVAKRDEAMNSGDKVGASVELGMKKLWVW